MKILIYNWTEEIKKQYNNKCSVCGKKAVRSIFNDSRVGNTVPAWYACLKRKCYVILAFNVISDIGSNEK